MNSRHAVPPWLIAVFFFLIQGSASLTWAEATLPPVPAREEDLWAEKKLDPVWTKSLMERGEPQVYRGEELKYIGMPVGGICSGLVYLGGDGTLWQWDIFNEKNFSGSSGQHYSHPLLPAPVFEQRFDLKIGDRTIPLNAKGFSDVTFRGEYPIGTVQYADAQVPLKVTLEAFSPFIPLNTEDSSMPAICLRYTLHNTSSASVETVLKGTLENAVCLYNRKYDGVLSNRTISEPGLTALFCSAEKSEKVSEARSDQIFEDWNKDTYDGWTLEGTAFGKGPIKKSQIPFYQGNRGEGTERVVSSQASGPGGSTAATGKLTSREFTIERNFISFWIGGAGARPNSRFRLTLFVDGQPVQTLAGQKSNLENFDVRAYAGKKARLEIFDDASGAWGNVCVGRIVFTDFPGKLEEFPDYGTMALSLLGKTTSEISPDATAPFAEKLSGSLGRKLTIAPGESTTVTFVISWYFPNLSNIPRIEEQGRSYAQHFDSALAVARYFTTNQERLIGDTFKWRQTWYDSTLPYWFLDRTFINISTLATTTCFRFKNGRFWSWEGVGSCAGTCGHVWVYAQAVAHLFPDLEREQREKVDFALSQKPDGAIRFRGENNSIPAIDAQAGYILRAYREHKMSTDDAFLSRIWPKVKLAMDWMIAKDGTGNGFIKGNQHNTLDTDWYGDVSWLSGLYQAALLASAEMAAVMKDSDYTRKCRDIAARGQQNLVSELFNGEYFVNKVDPNHLDAINSGTGCEIDQVFGQSLAFQMGLPRVFPKKETLSALKSLWHYNFLTDVGPYREVNKSGRWYARPGEAGLLMCSYPRSDWDFKKSAGKGASWAAGYFNECMNGFEHQVAGHMISEGMVQEGMAIERALHDRYSATKRNPYDEIECGDHYVRSMASYGVFLSACGFEYDGPNGYIAFSPRLTPENFKGPFTTAEGWGSYSQKWKEGGGEANLELKWGQVKLKSLSLTPNFKPKQVSVYLGDKVTDSTFTSEGDGVLITLSKDILAKEGQSLHIILVK